MANPRGPAEMADKPDANPPIVTGQTAVKDIGTAVDFVLQRRNIPRLNLLGWSWGTTLMATYTTQNASKVERLVLYAPSWIRQTASLVRQVRASLALTEWSIAIRRRSAGTPACRRTRKPISFPPAGSTPGRMRHSQPIRSGPGWNSPAVRAPNGVVQDNPQLFGASKSYYDPAKITVPTLLVGAEWDRDTPPYMAQTLFPLLVNSPGKRYVALAEGTHTIIMERNFG